MPEEIVCVTADAVKAIKHQADKINLANFIVNNLDLLFDSTLPSDIDRTGVRYIEIR